jgi:hypothetical protein
MIPTIPIIPIIPIIHYGEQLDAHGRYEGHVG